MNAFAAAGAGFLLAVLWFDLMFDVQLIQYRGGEVPGPVLDSISRYYARVTTAARPMNRLVAAVMLATLGSIVAEIADGEVASWVAWVSLALAAAAILLAGLRTVPNAVRLGGGGGEAAVRGELARSILRQHLICFACVLAVLVLQLASS